MGLEGRGTVSPQGAADPYRLLEEVASEANLARSRMAGGEFRFGTASMYMTRRKHT